MRQAAFWLFAVLLVCTGVLLVRVWLLERELQDLTQRISGEQEARVQADDRLQGDLERRVRGFGDQVASLDKNLRRVLERQDLEGQLPPEYTEALRAYVRDRIDDLVNQAPVFQTAWEIREVRFLSPDLLSVRCRDGEIEATLLVGIFVDEKGAYSGEVLYSDVHPWAG